jgi:hypothetical protein
MMFLMIIFYLDHMILKDFLKNLCKTKNKKIITNKNLFQNLMNNPGIQDIAHYLINFKLK